MPKRTDLKSILIIGAGPIVIGRRASSTIPARRHASAARGGLQSHPRQQQSGTIMTDPDMRCHLYRADYLAGVEKIIAKERPDRCCDQWAADCAELRARPGQARRAGKIRRRDDRCVEGSHRQGEDREKFKVAMTKIGSARRVRRLRIAGRSLAGAGGTGLSSIIRPSFTMAARAAHCYNRDEFVAICERGLEASPTHELLIEERCSAERVRDGSGARPQDNCIIICSIENFDRDGRAYRRLHHRGAGADAHRQGIPDHAQRESRGAARDRRETGGSTCSSPSPGRRAHVVIEMNPRVSRSSALASKATGFRSPSGGQAGGRLHLTTLQKRHYRRATRLVEPSIDYVVTKIPRFAFEKFPQADDRLTTQMKSVGEVNGDRPQLPGVAAESPARLGSRR